MLRLTRIIKTGLMKTALVTGNSKGTNQTIRGGHREETDTFKDLRNACGVREWYEKKQADAR